MLLTDLECPCLPFVKIRLAGLGVESELSLRCEIIECDPHELPTKSGLIALVSFQDS